MQPQQIHRIGFDPKSNTSRVSVFARKLKNTVCYHARYTLELPELANNQRFITESLKTDNLEVALERARQRFADIKHKEESRLALKPLLVGEAIDKFMADYKANMEAGVIGYTAPMYRNHDKTIVNYWKPYIGHKSLNAVTVDDMSGYELWRRKYAVDPKRPAHHNNKKLPAPATLKLEVNCFKTFLRWCAMRGHYQGRAYEYTFKRPVANPRSSLTIDQYRSLYRYMRSRAFSVVGKHGKDARIQRHRQMLRTYILVMANTGMRVGEARQLLWGDVTTRVNAKGQQVIAVRIAYGKGKVVKSREVIGRATAKIALDRYRKYLTARGEVITDKTPIWSDEKGVIKKDMREGFRKVMDEAGVAFDPDGRRHVIYSLRHTYISFRIRYGKNIDVYRLAKNCGTSTAMIEQYYDDTRAQDFIDSLS